MIDRPRTPTWVRALVVLALLGGLVGMHQLVAPPMTGAMDHGPAVTSSTAMPSPGHHHEAPDGHGSMLAHLCLAVLVALATALVAAVLVLLAAPTRRPGTARGPTPVLAGPAPVPRRLAALGVLRI